MKTLVAAAVLLVIASQPARAWTCKQINPSSRTSSLIGMDVDYSPETGWTIIAHVLNNGIVKVGNWHKSIVIENIDGSQWRGAPTALHLPKFEGWSAAGKLHLGEDGVMNYTQQIYDSSGKLDRQYDLKCHKELIS